MSASEHPADGPALLLTATINPGMVINTARSDPRLRLQDTRRALEWWMVHGTCRRIVLCESSGCPRDDFADLCDRAPDMGKELEYLTFRQDFPPEKGKGYGEIAIIRHALGSSAHLASAPMVLKCTGRYTVRNAFSLERQACNAEEMVICDLRENLREADCRWFAATPAFLSRYLLPRQERCNDRDGVFLEHALASAVHAAMADGFGWSMPDQLAVVDGIGGTRDKAIRTSVSKRLRYRLKKRFFAY